MQFADRDGHFASVVEKEVLAKDRKALLIAGGYHLFRQAYEERSETVVQRLERKYPAAAFVVLTHNPRSGALEPRVSSWPRPSLAVLNGTSLGAAEARLVRSNYKNQKIRLRDIANAYLYIAPFDKMTKSRPSPDTYDETYVDKIKRRYQLIFQEPLPPEVLQQIKQGLL